MPGPLVIPLIMAGAQITASMINRSKTKKLEEGDKSKVPDATHEAVTRARSLANASIAPGRAESEASIRQTQADTVGSAKRMFTDPTKIATILSGANVQSLRAGQVLDAQDKRYRAGAEANLAGALARKGQQEIGVEKENYGRIMQQQTANRNLLGAGFQNLLGANRESVMGSFLEQMYPGMDLSQGGLLKDFMGLFSGGGGGGGAPTGMPGVGGGGGGFGPGSGFM